MEMKEIFEGHETLTLEQFNEIATSKGAKFVDLSAGGYVSEKKFNSELASKDKQIESLNETITQRDTDLEAVKTQLAEAGNDAEKLSEVSNQLSTLQSKYDEDTKAFQTQLSQQAREFAVKEYASTKQFTSSAAKRDYIEQMLKAEDVKFNKKGQLVGMEDFDTDYATDNADAFVIETPPEPAAPAEPKPSFAASTPGTEAPKKPTLSEMMAMKNANPDMPINF